MEGLLKQIRGNGVGFTDPFAMVRKLKKDDNYPIYDEDTHWRLKKPIVSVCNVTVF